MARKTRAKASSRLTVVTQTADGKLSGTPEALQRRRHNGEALVTAMRRDAAETLGSNDAGKIGQLLQTALRVLRDRPLPALNRDFHAVRLTVAYRTHIVLAPSPAKYLLGELTDGLDESPPPGTPREVVKADIEENRSHLAYLRKELDYTRKDYEALVKKAARWTDNQAWHIGLGIALLHITDHIDFEAGWADNLMACDPTAVGESFMSMRSAYVACENGSRWETVAPTLKRLKLDSN